MDTLKQSLESSKEQKADDQDHVNKTSFGEMPDAQQHFSILMVQKGENPDLSKIIDHQSRNDGHSAVFQGGSFNQSSNLVTYKEGLEQEDALLQNGNRGEAHDEKGNMGSTDRAAKSPNSKMPFKDRESMMQKHYQFPAQKKTDQPFKQMPSYRSQKSQKSQRSDNQSDRRPSALSRPRSRNSQSNEPSRQQQVLPQQPQTGQPTTNQRDTLQGSITVPNDISKTNIQSWSSQWQPGRQSALKHRTNDYVDPQIVSVEAIHYQNPGSPNFGKLVSEAAREKQISPSLSANLMKGNLQKTAKPDILRSTAERYKVAGVSSSVPEPGYKSTKKRDDHQVQTLKGSHLFSKAMNSNNSSQEEGISKKKGEHGTLEPPTVGQSLKAIIAHHSPTENPDGELDQQQPALPLSQAEQGEFSLELNRISLTKSMHGLISRIEALPRHYQECKYIAVLRQINELGQSLDEMDLEERVELVQLCQCMPPSQMDPRSGSGGSWIPYQKKPNHLPKRRRAKKRSPRGRTQAPTKTVPFQSPQNNISKQNNQARIKALLQTCGENFENTNEDELREILTLLDRIEKGNDSNSGEESEAKIPEYHISSLQTNPNVRTRLKNQKKAMFNTLWKYQKGLEKSQVTKPAQYRRAMTTQLAYKSQFKKQLEDVRSSEADPSSYRAGFSSRENVPYHYQGSDTMGQLTARTFQYPAINESDQAIRQYPQTSRFHGTANGSFHFRNPFDSRAAVKAKGTQNNQSLAISPLYGFKKEFFKNSDILASQNMISPKVLLKNEQAIKESLPTARVPSLQQSLPSERSKSQSPRQQLKKKKDKPRLESPASNKNKTIEDVVAKSHMHTPMSSSPHPGQTLGNIYSIEMDLITKQIGPSTSKAQDSKETVLSNPLPKDANLKTMFKAVIPTTSEEAPGVQSKTKEEVPLENSRTQFEEHKLADIQRVLQEHSSQLEHRPTIPPKIQLPVKKYELHKQTLNDTLDLPNQEIWKMTALPTPKPIRTRPGLHQTRVGAVINPDFSPTIGSRLNTHKYSDKDSINQDLKPEQVVTNPPVQRKDPHSKKNIKAQIPNVSPSTTFHLHDKIKDSKFSTSKFSNFSMSHPLNLGKFESSPVTIVRTMQNSQMDKKGTLPIQESVKNTTTGKRETELDGAPQFQPSKGNSSVFFNSSDIQRSSEPAKNISKSGSKASIQVPQTAIEVSIEQQQNSSFDNTVKPKNIQIIEQLSEKNHTLHKPPSLTQVQENSSVHNERKVTDHATGIGEEKDLEVNQSLKKLTKDTVKSSSINRTEDISSMEIASEQRRTADHGVTNRITKKTIVVQNTQRNQVLSQQAKPFMMTQSFNASPKQKVEFPVDTQTVQRDSLENQPMASKNSEDPNGMSPHHAGDYFIDDMTQSPIIFSNRIYVNNINSSHNSRPTPPKTKQPINQISVQNQYESTAPSQLGRNKRGSPRGSGQPSPRSPEFSRKQHISMGFSPKRDPSLKTGGELASPVGKGGNIVSSMQSTKGGPFNKDISKVNSIAKTSDIHESQIPGWSKVGIRQIAYEGKDVSAPATRGKDVYSSSQRGHPSFFPRGNVTNNFTSLTRRDRQGGKKKSIVMQGISLHHEMSRQEQIKSQQDHHNNGGGRFKTIEFRLSMLDSLSPQFVEAPSVLPTIQASKLEPKPKSRATPFYSMKQNSIHQSTEHHPPLPRTPHDDEEVVIKPDALSNNDLPQDGRNSQLDSKLTHNNSELSKNAATLDQSGFPMSAISRIQTQEGGKLPISGPPGTSMESRREPDPMMNTQVTSDHQKSQRKTAFESYRGDESKQLIQSTTFENAKSKQHPFQLKEIKHKRTKKLLSMKGSDLGGRDQTMAGMSERQFNPIDLRVISGYSNERDGENVDPNQFPMQIGTPSILSSLPGTAKGNAKQRVKDLALDEIGSQLINYQTQLMQAASTAPARKSNFPGRMIINQTQQIKNILPSFRGFKGSRQVRGGTAVGVQMARQTPLINSVNERKKKKLPIKLQSLDATECYASTDEQNRASKLSAGQYKEEALNWSKVMRQADAAGKKQSSQWSSGKMKFLNAAIAENLNKPEPNKQDSLQFDSKAFESQMESAVSFMPRHLSQQYNNHSHANRGSIQNNASVYQGSAFQGSRQLQDSVIHRARAPRNETLAAIISGTSTNKPQG